MKDLMVSSSSFINTSYIDERVTRSLDVKLEDGTACEVVLTYKDVKGKELGVFSDEAYVYNNHISYPFNIKEIADKLDVNERELDHIIAAVDIDHDGEISSGEEVRLDITPVLNILVLVAGTTDPINADDKGTRAHSYESDYMYWDADFTKQIKEFVNEYKNLKLFPFHGWTGDNSIKNRKISGAYLVNRLCGAENEKAFYESSYQNRPIHFHLLGHSHGGNVINEMTIQMDKLGSRWPEKWKVKSLTYLSTPFFTKIHQLKVTDKTFHKDAEMLSLYNDYDLTQRMLADFSMEPLAGAFQSIDTESLTTEIDNLIDSSKEVPFDCLKDWSFSISHNEGIELYSKTRIMLISLRDVLSEVLKLIKSLNRDYTFVVDENIVDKEGNKLSNKRQFIGDDVYQQFEEIFSRLENNVNTVVTALTDALDAHVDSSFSKLDYFKALLEGTDFIQNLNLLLDIDSTTFQSVSNPSLWTLLAQVLKENIRNYDNTYQKPEDGEQFQGLNININPSLDVTQRDLYDGSKGSDSYRKFVKDIEKIEKSYAKTPSEHNLLDLLFTLLAQDESVYSIIKIITDWKTMLGYSEYIVTGDVDTTVKALKHTLINLEEVFDSRRYGKEISTKDEIEYRSSLIDERHSFTKSDEAKNNDSDPHNNVLKPGSLMYLLQESHSTSRRVLHKEVREFIERLGAKK